MTKTRTEKDLTGLDGVDPKTHPAKDATHFRAIIAARKRLAEAEEELRRAVTEAHEAGDSWTVIGAALDISRQAAWERFGKPEPESPVSRLIPRKRAAR
jgi:hypothetical protein